MEYLFKSNTQALGVSFSVIILVVIIKVTWLDWRAGKSFGVQESPTSYGFNIHVGSGLYLQMLLFLHQRAAKEDGRKLSLFVHAWGVVAMSYSQVPYLGALYSSERVSPA